MLVLELPWPPSVNHYWRHFRGRVVISQEGVRFRSAVKWIVLAKCRAPLTGRLAVTVHAYPPDRRERDLDNLLKATQDALCHGGAFVSDSQIDWLLIERHEVVPNGKIIVWIDERGTTK